MKLRNAHRAGLAALVLLALVPLGLSAQAGTPLVSSSLNQDLVKIFPELAQGYLDFNGNGKADAAGDVSELIPESRVKDGQLQAQEVLDFVVANWRFLPLAKLRAVQAAVKGGSGALQELIAIDFASSLGDALAQREAMGDILYLTPSAYKEAMARIGGIITTMANAYKKEGAKAEGEFVSSRDALFGMIEKGYPLPQDIPAEEKSTLSTAMVSTILKEKASNPGRTRSAIRTLGQLKSQDAAAYLLSLAEASDYQVESIKALGETGYRPAVPVLVKQLKTSKDGEVRRVSILALGAIGAPEGLDAILELLKAPARASLPKDLLQASSQALSGLAQKGNADYRVQTALKDLSTDLDSLVRRSAATGLGSLPSTQSTEALVAVLGTDKDPGVRTQAVLALAKQKGDTVVPAFLKVLREKDLDPGLEIATLGALGDNPGGSQAVNLMVEELADKNEGVRAAAAAALRKLYPANPQPITGALTRSLLASQDQAFLMAGSALLADLADPSTLVSLLTLLQSPLPEVKRNVAWAFYKIRASTNPRVMDELQKLITNENETVSVRATAIRAVGAIGFDSPQLNLWQTLVTTAQMRGEKYAMLRWYAVEALGRVGAGKPGALAALARIASKESDLELRKVAVESLKVLAAQDAGVEEALVSAFAQAEDGDLKVLVLEALADMGSQKPASLAGDFLAAPGSGGASLAQKRRVLTALSEAPTEDSAQAILDACKDPKVLEFAQAVLEGYPASLMTGLVSRRTRTESDKNVLSVLTALSQRFVE